MKMRTRRERDSGGSNLQELLVGALLLSICFIVLCAYAAHQRDGLGHADRNRPSSVTASVAASAASAPSAAHTAEFVP
jgi:hypothetical protein